MTLQERIDQAKLAYHQLMVGESVIEVRDQNGETIRYSRVDANKLLAYIRSLEFELNGKIGRPLKTLF